MNSPSNPSQPDEITPGDLLPLPKASIAMGVAPRPDLSLANQALSRGMSGSGDLPEMDATSLAEWLSIIWAGRYLILGILAVVMAASAFRLWRTTPIYQVKAMLQIEEKRRSISDKGLSEFDGIISGGSEAATEMEIIRSNLVLGRAVESLGLDIRAYPVLTGLFADTRARGKADAPRLEADSFVLPDALRGRAFTIVTLEGGSFRWEAPDGHPLATGKPGQVLTGILGEDTLRLRVSSLQGKPGQTFTLVRQPLQQAIDGLLGNLVVAEKGKYTGILGLTLTDPNPARAARSLNEILNQYVHQNIERKSEEVSKTLVFLNEQMPSLKAKVDQAEDALNKFRERSGSVDLPQEAQLMLKQSVDLNAQMLLMKQKKDELLRTYKEGSDVVATLNEQYNKLSKEAKQVESKVRTLPRTQQEVVGLQRDVQVNTGLYTALLGNIQQLQVLNAGQVGNARIVDLATPTLYPIKPNKSSVMTISLALGLLAGMGLVMLLTSLRQGVKEPNLIETKLGMPVYVTVPHSLTQEALSRSIRNRLDGTNLLAHTNSDDIAIESLRSLRTTLHFTLADAVNRVIVIAGPAPNIGKSFVSANFAAVLAQGGGRVLLVDGDMRKGNLHHYFGVKSRKNGLSEILAGRVAWEQTIHRTPVSGLDVIFTGIVPPNPSELLMKDRFSTFVSEISEAYNYVIIDAPPMMAVTDSIIIGTKAGTFLLVTKFGEHPLDEIRTCQARCEDIGIHISGCIFNDIPGSKIGNRYYRYGYHYKYK